MSDPSPSLRNAAKPGLVAPAAVRIVDIDSPLPALSSRDNPAAAPFKSIQLVVRLAGEPLGAAILAPVPEAGVLPRDVADAVRAARARAPRSTRSTWHRAAGLASSERLRATETWQRRADRDSSARHGGRRDLPQPRTAATVPGVDLPVRL